MFKTIQLEAKNDEEALAQAVTEFKISEDKITLNLIREEKETNVYEAYVDVLLPLEGKKYIQRVLNALGIEFQIDVRSVNNSTDIYYTLQTEENSLLIGKNGKNLDALQMLLKIYLNDFTTENIRVTIDIGNYKEQRKRQLEILATKLAKEVVSTKRDITLKPMNSYERRVIHTKLGEWRDVYTESVGEGIDRKLVIKYKRK